MSISWSEHSLYHAFLSIAFNPIFWNIIARREHNSRFLTKFFGSPLIGCYFLAGAIFTLNIIRDWLYAHNRVLVSLVALIDRPDSTLRLKSSQESTTCLKKLPHHSHG
jgi:phosphatidylethanolamine N-methyltransferase